MHGPRTLQLTGTPTLAHLLLPAPPPSGAPWSPTPQQNLDPNILRDIRAHGYDRPTPIQAQGVPVSLTGRDILGCAETGSGKTASFAIPMVQHCLQQEPLRRGDGPMALVLAPTRELAQQIEVEMGKFSLSSKGKVCAVVSAC